MFVRFAALCWTACLVALPAFAQSPNPPPDTLWTRTFDACAYAQGITETSDGHLALACYAPSTPGLSDLLLYKLTPAGEVLWQRRYPQGPYPTQVLEVLATDDGGVILAGRREFALRLNKGYLRRVAADGSTMWERTTGAEPNAYVHAATAAPNGDVILAGNGGGGIYLARVDRRGALRWEAKTDSMNAWVRDVTALPDGRIVVVGQTQGRYPFPFHFYTPTTGFAGWFDADGTLTGFHDLEPSDPDARDDWSTAFVAEADAGAGVTVAGSVDYTSHDGPEVMKLVHLNAEREPVWRARFEESPYPDSLYTLTEIPPRFAPRSAARLASGDLVLAGYYDWYGRLIASREYDSIADALIATFASDGTLRWYQRFGVDGAGETFANVVAMRSGQIVAAGSQRTSSGNGEHKSALYLVALDVPTPTATAPPAEPSGQRLDAYPHPVRTVATVHYALPQAGPATLSLYDMLGRRVRTLRRGALPAGEGSVRLEVTGLPAGAYLLRLTAGAASAQRTVVVQP